MYEGLGSLALAPVGVERRYLVMAYFPGDVWVHCSWRCGHLAYFMGPSKCRVWCGARLGDASRAGSTRDRGEMNSW